MLLGRVSELISHRADLRCRLLLGPSQRDEALRRVRDAAFAVEYGPEKEELGVSIRTARKHFGTRLISSQLLARSCRPIGAVECPTLR
jgi:hypothetical protein